MFTAAGAFAHQIGLFVMMMQINWAMKTAGIGETHDR
jgi:hypothetical protein